MEIMIKMSAAEADEAMAKGILQALVYPFSCRETVRKAAKQKVEKAAEIKAEKVEKEESKAEPKTEPKEPEKPKEEPTEPKEEQTEEKKIKLTDIRKRLTKAKQDGQRDLMKVLFKDFGIKNLTDLKEDQYANFYAKAEEVFNA